MEYSSRELIEEFYNEYDTEASFEDFNLACQSQFEMVAREMKSGSLKNIRLKYLCSFVVFPGRVQHMKRNLEQRKENGTVSDNDYQKYMEMYNNYELGNKED